MCIKNKYNIYIIKILNILFKMIYKSYLYVKYNYKINTIYFVYIVDSISFK